MTNPDFNALMKTALDIARSQIKAEGCLGCVFYDKEEWDMPCRCCKRNCRDYWRAKPQEEGDE